MASAPNSSTKQPLYRKFLRPSWLAGTISVGFHGALFAAGPMFPSLGFSDLVEPELEAERRNVPLVELTEAEQQRLPDFSSSLYSFDTFNDLEPLSPLFSQEDLPTSEGDAAIAEGVPSPLTRRRSFSVPSTRIPFGITSLEPRRGTSPIPSLPDAEGLPSSPPAGAGAPASGAGAGPTGNSSPREEGTAADLAQPGGPGDQTETDIAALGNNPTEVMTLEERLQAYTYDAADTEAEAAETRFDEWISTGRAFVEELAIADEVAIPEDIDLMASAAEAAEAAEADEAAEEDSIVRAPIEFTIDYERGFCLTKEPQKGLIGAWVSPEGELLGEPEIIRSTGYAGLNQQAVQYISTLDFSTVDTFTGYQFEVVVNYDPENCVRVGRNGSATDEDEDVARDRENPDSENSQPAKVPSSEIRPNRSAPTAAPEDNAAPAPEATATPEPDAPANRSDDAAETPDDRSDDTAD